MNAPGQCEVLVVGAGPTGLTLGATLARLGVRTTVIEKADARSKHSKAIGVQAGSLEALGQAFGQALPEKMISAGLPIRDAYFHFGAQQSVHVDVGRIPSEYNFVLSLSQSETERFLEEEITRSSLEVERRKELLSLDTRGAKVIARVGDAQGEIQEITADFVVGCDGAHSIVRRDAGIRFAGGSYRGDFILGDVVLDWPWTKDAVRLFMSDRGFLGGFPMRGEPGTYRLMMVSEVDQSAVTPEISPEEFLEILERRTPEPITIKRTIWLSRFNLHHRMAEHFRSGRIFLAGDAAHIHSPVGGQGMNTGIQDALNLGSKLAAVLRRGRSLDTLDRYERERLPVARAILRRTDRAFRGVMALNTGRMRRWRLWLAPRIVGSSWLQRRMARTISQVVVARREMAERAADGI